MSAKPKQQYFVGKKKNAAAHIWTGEDTVCRMASTGGLKRSRYEVTDEKPPGKRICLNCQDLQGIARDSEREPKPLPVKSEAPRREPARYWNGDEQTKDLGLKRERDLNTLAHMRSPVTELRRRFLYLLSVVVAWKCPDLISLVEELDDFALKYFEDHERYLGPENVRQTLGYVSHRALLGNPMYGEKVIPDVRVSNFDIIDLLYISPEEQTYMLNVIDVVEKKRRQAVKWARKPARPRKAKASAIRAMKEDSTATKDPDGGNDDPPWSTDEETVH